MQLNKKVNSIIRPCSSIKPIQIKNKNVLNFIWQEFFKENKCNLSIQKYNTDLMDNSKPLKFTFEDLYRFLTMLLKNNKINVYYLMRNINLIIDNSLILQEVQELLPIAIFSIINSTSNTSDFQNIDECIISLNIYNIFYDNKFFILMKNLFNMFTVQRSILPFYKKVFLQLRKINNIDHTLYPIDIKFHIDWKKQKHFKLEHYYFFCSLLSNYNNLINDNIILVQQIKSLKKKLKLNNSVCNVNNCKNCLKLKENILILTEKYDNIIKNYSTLQNEKEKMVMKYATSEKRVIEGKRCIKLTEKKYQDTLKENVILHKRIEKAHDNITKITNEINSKSSEILRLRIEIEHYKNNDNSKELQIRCNQNRLKFITNAHKETQMKLNESMLKTSEVTNECNQLRSQMKEIIKKIQKIDEKKSIIFDQQLKEQQARVILERHIAEDSESCRIKLQKELNLLLDRQRFTNNEHNLLISKIESLKIESANYKSKWNTLYSSFEKERADTETLKNEVSQIEILNKQLKSKEHLLSTTEAELKRLEIEKIEFQADIEMYRQREMQMLDFTQKLTDKNVQLQCNFANMEYKVHHLENTQKPLNIAIDKFKNDIKTLEYNLSIAKKDRLQESELLTKYIAEQVLCNQKLVNRLENVEGENLILRKKYDLTIREMTRELQLCQHLR